MLSRYQDETDACKKHFFLQRLSVRRPNASFSVSDAEIAAAVREVQSGRPAHELCAAFGISLRTLFRWRRRFGDLKPFAVRALRELEQENHRLRAEAARLVTSAPPYAAPQIATIMTRSDLGSGRISPGEPRVATVVGRYAALRLR